MLCPASLIDRLLAVRCRLSLRLLLQLSEMYKNVYPCLKNGHEGKAGRRDIQDAESLRFVYRRKSGACRIPVLKDTGRRSVPVLR